jgi:hypothetical protein
MKNIINNIWIEISKINNFFILFSTVIISVSFSLVISGYNQITIESLIALFICFPLTIILEIALLISRRYMEILFLVIGYFLLIFNIAIQSLWLCPFAVGFTISAIFVGVHHKYEEKKIYNL